MTLVIAATKQHFFTYLRLVNGQPKDHHYVSGPERLMGSDPSTKVVCYGPFHWSKAATAAWAVARERGHPIEYRER